MRAAGLANGFKLRREEVPTGLNWCTRICNPVQPLRHGTALRRAFLHAEDGPKGSRLAPAMTLQWPLPLPALR